MRCTNCQSETTDIGDIHCRKIFLNQIKLLISQDKLYEAKQLCINTKFNKNESNIWKNIWAKEVQKLIIEKDRKKGFINRDDSLLKETKELERLGSFWTDKYQKTKNLWDICQASKNYREAGRSEEAIRVTNCIIGLKQINDKNAFGAVLTTRGAAYKDIGNYDFAEKCAREAIKYNEKISYVYELLGAIFIKTNEFDKADFYFQKANELEPKTINEFENKTYKSEKKIYKPRYLTKLMARNLKKKKHSVVFKK